MVALMRNLLFETMECWSATARKRRTSLYWCCATLQTMWYVKYLPCIQCVWRWSHCVGKNVERSSPFKI